MKPESVKSFLQEQSFTLLFDSHISFKILQLMWSN